MYLGKKINTNTKHGCLLENHFFWRMRAMEVFTFGKLLLLCFASDWICKENIFREKYVFVTYSVWFVRRFKASGVQNTINRRQSLHQTSWHVRKTANGKRGTILQRHLQNIDAWFWLLAPFKPNPLEPLGDSANIHLARICLALTWRVLKINYHQICAICGISW